MPTKTADKCRFCASLTHTYDKLAVAEILNKELFIGGLKPTDAQLKELISEVTLLTSTSLWKILTSTVRAQGVNMGVRDAKTFDDVLLAKSMLHVVGIQESCVEAILTEGRARELAAKITAGGAGGSGAVK